MGEGSVSENFWQVPNWSDNCISKITRLVGSSALVQHVEFVEKQSEERQNNRLLNGQVLLLRLFS